MSLGSGEEHRMEVIGRFLGVIVALLGEPAVRNTLMSTLPMQTSPTRLPYGPQPSSN